jgi:5,10-methylenetetrahydromethanopterin reductase
MLLETVEDMRLSLGVTTSMPVEDSIYLARLAETGDYHRVWVGEDLQGKDVFSYLSVLACKTRSIGLGTGITSPWVRNLGVIANSAAGIQALSGERFILGLGVGGLPELLRLTGSKPRKTVARMNEIVRLLRRIFKGVEVTHHGDFNSLRGYELAFEVSSPKIYFGVRGPMMLKLAGEVADGVIFSGPLKFITRDVKIMEEAAEEKGRNPGEIDRVLWNPFILTENSEDLDLARDVVSVILGSMPHSAHEFPGGGKIEELCVYGSKREIMKKLSEYEALGFRELVIGPPYGRNPGDVVASFGGMEE